MHPTPVSLTARTLYAELQELAIAIGATENLGQTPGTLVYKNVRARRYVYYQYRDLDGRTRQTYLGPDDETTRALTRRLKQRAEDRADDLRRLDELRAAFIGAGGSATQQAPMKVLKAFSDAGILRPGPGQAVLVGTHAFNALGNLLGVRWASHVQTHDIDLAGERDIDIAIHAARPPLPDVLTRLEMGFVPIPSLDPRLPSTSYRVRGRELRVDLLTPLVGKATDRPMIVASLNAPAQPVRFLDYLIEEPTPCVIVGRTSLVLANVPLPERFALHKLIVSESRASVFANKAEKDRLQAVQLLEVLIVEAPDGIRRAKIDLIDRGKGWRERFERALAKLRKAAPEVVEHVAAL